MKTFTRGKAINVRENEEFALELEVLSSGGYEWTVADETPGVVLVKSSFDTRKQKGVGGASTQTLHLRAESAGSHELRLVCKRPWDSKPAETLSVKVTVK